ncbi:4-carboxymuconolactone decarboxylase [Pseudomonas syringae pv. actinidiae]|nr:4-carboxymuconolactone decarboxylase [Pseudomonas syringae pv. actinidiae]
MDAFNYRDGELFAEGVALSAIAERFGTPTYVYSRAHIEAQYRAFADALSGMPHMVCFAVKANSNLGVLNVLARLGAGFDIVSRGELERVLAAGGKAERIVFSGVGKTREDMRRALEVGVHCFNVESTDELERLQEVAAELDVRAPISLRVNPDVDAGTHPYISTGLKENKFGIAIAAAEDVYIRASQLPNLEVIGVDCHIGSQLTTLEPFIDALDRLLDPAHYLGQARLWVERAVAEHKDLPMTEDERYEAGMQVRRAVLGDTHVDNSLSKLTPFNEEFQEMITRHAWGDIWTRPGLPRHTRSLITIAMLIGMNREGELRLHLKAAKNNGVTREEIKEVLMQSAIYCGIPAANATFHLAEAVWDEMGVESLKEE